VANVAPQVFGPGDVRIKENSRLRGAGSCADPGADAWTATVDYGDGSGERPLALEGKRFVLDHRYARPGTYTATVRVTDSDGQSGLYRFRVEVTNVRPTLLPQKDMALQPGELFRRQLRWRDPGQGPGAW
jgi:hypothetical protein